MELDYKNIKKAIKSNPPTTYYPNPDDFEEYDEYAEAYDDAKDLYMSNIARSLGYSGYKEMFKSLGDVNLDDAEEDLFGFFYENMVADDYYDWKYASDDDDDNYYDDEDPYGDYSDDY